MTKVKNPVWQFLASVKLALFVLIILAVSSVFGTLIQQGKPTAYYVEEFGPAWAGILEGLSLTTMYTSWWFIALLALFAANLVVCSIERLPRAWRQMSKDHLDIDPAALKKMNATHRLGSDHSPAAAVDRIQQVLRRGGWRNLQRKNTGGGTLLFSQKGAWSGMGVYVVHLSILVILVGALAGMLFGFQAYVYLPEGRSTDHVYERYSREAVPLGFNLRCDGFEKTYYPNGMVKQYRSDLTVIDPGRQVTYPKSIIVNDPLSYQGFTFYQGDAYPMEEFLVLLQDQRTGAEQAFRVPPATDVAWTDTLSFRIDEVETNQDGEVKEAKLVFSGGPNGASDVWIKNKGMSSIGLPGGELTFSLRQLYSSLLLIKKDPGVSIIFAGALIMVIGLFICVLLSHQRLWIQISATKGGKGSQILISGSASKNKAAFERKFNDLATLLDENLKGKTRRSGDEGSDVVDELRKVV